MLCRCWKGGSDATPSPGKSKAIPTSVRTTRKRFLQRGGGGDSAGNDDGGGGSGSLVRRYIRDLGNHMNAEGMSHAVLSDLLRQGSLSSRFCGILPDWEPETFQPVLARIKAAHQQQQRRGRRRGAIDNSDAFVQFFIANVGYHFVVVLVQQHEISYFDPFGAPPSEKLKAHFLDRVPFLPVRFSSTKIQSESSSFCGLYACLLIVVFDMAAERDYLYREHRKFLRLAKLNLRREQASTTRAGSTQSDEQSRAKSIEAFRRKHPIRFAASTKSKPLPDSALLRNDEQCADLLTKYIVFWGVHYPVG